ncbi:MAG: S-layer protein [Planctomycetes bacterium]|nr:S-layer protein [Planctomycetota bacterium]MBL7038513.1 S-layer protein [Pirellulaceae bacterium]
MKTTSVVLSSVLLILGPAGGHVSAETTIVVNFGPCASAAVAGRGEAKVNWLDVDNTDDTVCTECFAALELQCYLRKMTGRADDFAIVDDGNAPDGELILVGGPQSNAVSRELANRLGVSAESLSELGQEGYRIKAATLDGRRITLVAGGGRVGTLYGAYDLLYRMSCRWFGPGELHDVVPHAEKVSELDISERPAFSVRGFRARTWDRPEPGLGFFLWMARNRLNLWSLEKSDPALLRKLGIKMACGGHTAMHLFLNPGAAYPYDHPSFKGDEKESKDPYAQSAQYSGDADKDRKLTYFEAHPEWFALVDGRRIPGLRGEWGTNFCTSNRDAAAEFVKNHVQALIDGEYQHADMVRLWTLDGGKWCQCDACKTLGNRTDRYLRLVQEFDQGIKKAQAEGKINRPIIVRFLVYADVLEPPTRPLPRDFDYKSCVGTFFPIGRCYVHNFDHPDCPANAGYLRQLHGWAVDPDRHYEGQLCIGEYYNISGFRSLPICFMHTMANDIPKYYHKGGARHFHYMHCTNGNWGNKALTNYQMARQIWDPDADCEALWEDYFARRYGPVAGTMRRFYESLEQMLANARELKYGLARRLDKGSENLFPNSHLQYRREPGVECEGPTLVEIVGHAETCRKLVDEAMAAEIPDPIKARIKEDERLFKYGERTVTYYDACAQAFELVRAGEKDEARRHYAEARRIAELLRKDVTSATLFVPAIIARPDAFAASGASRALEHLEKLLR